MDAMTAPTGEAAIEIRTEADGWWTNTPWWLVSAGVHLVILLVKRSIPGIQVIKFERLIGIHTCMRLLYPV